MEDLYAGINLGEVTTSMTINSPAAVAMLSLRPGKMETARLGGRAKRHLEGVPSSERIRVPTSPVDAARS